MSDAERQNLAAAGHIEFVDPAYVAPPEPAAARPDGRGLVAFVTARAAEREALALAATPGPWSAKPVVYRPGDGYGDLEDSYWEVLAGEADVVSHQMHEGGGASAADARHIAANGPARVLREVAASRELLGLHEDCGWGTGLCDDGGHADDGMCSVKRYLASLDSDHSDYDPAWATS